MHRCWGPPERGIALPHCRPQERGGEGRGGEKRRRRRFIEKGKEGRGGEGNEKMWRGRENTRRRSGEGERVERADTIDVTPSVTSKRLETFETGSCPPS